MWGGLTQRTAARGGHAGTGAGDTDVCHWCAGLSVEIIPAVLASGSVCVALAVEAFAWQNRREGKRVV